jgi:hypothetical protein
MDNNIDLTACLAEMNHVLNYWYPLESNGCEQAECAARHIRLFQFRDRLEAQLKANGQEGAI